MRSSSSTAGKTRLTIPSCCARVASIGAPSRHSSSVAARCSSSRAARAALRLADRPDRDGPGAALSLPQPRLQTGQPQVVAGQAHRGFVEDQLSDLGLAQALAPGQTVTVGAGTGAAGTATVHAIVKGVDVRYFVAAAIQPWFYLTPIFYPVTLIGSARPWLEVRSSYDRALRVHTLGLGADTEEHLAELVLTADPSAYADLRARVLAPLDQLRDSSAEKLTETLRSWLLHHGRRDAVAAELFVHPQTVRYRMGQLREVFGDRLEDPRSVLELTIALGLVAKTDSPE